MFKFSKQSQERLTTCDSRLQFIATKALNIGLIDFTVVTGHRSKVDQMIAVQEGRSKVVWPNSKHNKTPSFAMDLAPYHNGINWNDTRPFYLLAGIILSIANNEGIKIRWGGAWNGDLNIYRADKILMDLPHFEITGD